MAQSFLSTWNVQQPTKIEVTLASAAILLLYLIQRILNTLYLTSFHPLSQFPGPPKAARSRSYIYTITGDHPEETLEKLHEKYQTQALRIGPNELHITDITQYKVIYSQTQPFPKDKEFYDAFNTPHTVVTETEIELHKEHRRILNPLFSRAESFKLEPLIHEKVAVLLGQINKLKGVQNINIYNAFRCLTTEIVMEFVFAKPENLLDDDNNEFESWFQAAFDAAAESFWLMEERPWLWKMSNYLPLSFVELVKPEAANVFKLLQYAETCLQHYEKNGNTTSHPVLFDHLSTLPHQIKVAEALIILVAGSDTTASTLTSGLLHILSNPLICDRLTQELSDADPSFQMLNLEKVKYLTACVKESLRIGMAVPGRLPRVVPQDLSQPFIVDGKVIPPGTVVSMSAYTMHTSEEIWGVDARSFNPDRWLTPEAKSLEQYMCAFSKGTRMCLGQNLALAEVTIIMAYMFRSFKMSLLPDAEPPRRKDLFTMGYEKPGLSLKFMDMGNKTE
ncbi:uncharacterized protein N7511_007641 [Penicillium nucicola]|uniref:uncharacterized protein n=1 Tax=Penicillium nucicola TaxID=1850975 RepID=UPI002545BD0F|nr:uncharacterized protein N7511_007641 [Penicillium nucicola]KAJ5753488.1 hypothetical protein N7511_007641 [Penicillium nucicola]